MSRTHIVDLGLMPREQLIEIAKKQANQIREKNIRISAMEAFIEGVTGNSAEESLQRSSSAYTAASASSSFAGGFVNIGHPAPQSGSGSDTNASTQLRELRQLLEEEQVQHTIRISDLERRLGERQAEYEALQSKADTWKAKVMAVMTADRERIQQLEGQLAAATLLVSGGAAASQGYPLPTDPTAPQKHGGEQTTALPLQSPMPAQPSEWKTPHPSLRQTAMEPQQQTTHLSHAAGASTPEDAQIAPHVMLASSLSPTTSTANPPITDPSQVPQEILSAAVHAKLETWKQRAKATLIENQNRIEELEQQLAAAQQERDAALDRESAAAVCAARESESEVEALRADVARLEQQLGVAQEEGDVARVAMSAFRAKMEAWKGKVRSLVEERERERDALRVEVGRLNDEVAAAKLNAVKAAAVAAEYRRKAEEASLGAADPAELSLNSKSLSCVVGEGLREGAPSSSPSVHATVSSGVAIGLPLLPEPPCSPDAERWESLLSDCERLVGENEKLRRVVAELLRFKRCVMEDVRSVGALMRLHD